HARRADGAGAASAATAVDGTGRGHRLDSVCAAVPAGAGSSAEPGQPIRRAYLMGLLKLPGGGEITELVEGFRAELAAIRGLLEQLLELELEGKREAQRD